MLFQNLEKQILINQQRSKRFNIIIKWYNQQNIYAHPILQRVQDLLYALINKADRANLDANKFIIYFHFFKVLHLFCSKLYGLTCVS